MLFSFQALIVVAVASKQANYTVNYQLNLSKLFPNHLGQHA